MDRELGLLLPYSQEPLEQTAEWYAAITSRRDYTVDMEFVLDELRELVQVWRDVCHAERKALTEPREKHPLPLEYSAGLAQGLEKAAAELERIIEDATLSPAA